MDLTCYGAAGEVTGSMHLLRTDEDRVLLDCGLFQGRRAEMAAKNREIPIDPATLTNIVLSHAHIDHSGRLPLLVKNNFPGRIFATRATRDACDYMLRDSAHIQESDAEYLNYKAVRRALHRETQKGDTKKDRQARKEARNLLKTGRDQLNRKKISELAGQLGISMVEPLYSSDDAVNALAHFEGIPYRNPVTVGRKMTLTFYEAGHILGSAVSILTCRHQGQIKRICYTGDLGRFGKAIIRDPNLDFAAEDRDIDLLIIESTYGNREHEPVQDLSGRMKSVLNETLEKGGSVVIPSFAFGRTQEMLYTIHELFRDQEVPRVPVYVDSPLAGNLTRVFTEHPEVYDRETHKTFLEKGANPFVFDDVHFVSSVEASMEVMREEQRHIVISASGMCEFGRILHHLRYKIHNALNTILIVGYMAENTLGRRILEEGRAYQDSGRSGGPPEMKILGKAYPLKARVESIGGFSAHADKNELMTFVKKSNLNIRRAAVVHGEAEQARVFSEALRKEGVEAIVPGPGETFLI